MNHKHRKHLGQHFLHDPNILAKIVSAIAPEKTDNIIEIGPGAGALTSQILPLAKSMTAIEIDQDLIPILQQSCQPLGELILIAQDVLTVEFDQLGENMRIIGNLPYNISTPILFHLVKTIDQISDMHFMLQKEVVDRLAASPGNKDYGRLSVMLQYYCDIEFLFKVPPGAFTPPPKVESAVVRLAPRRPNLLPNVSYASLSHIVRLAFGQRRKMLRKSLKPQVTADQLESLGIDPTLRAEQLTVEDFCRICIMAESDNNRD